MLTRTVFSWNNLISDYLAEKSLNKVLGLFSWMIHENQFLNEYTFSLVLKVCDDLNLVKKIHGQVVCCGFSTSPLVCNRLIDVYSKNACIEYARKVFDKLCVRDSVSWVAILSGLSQNQKEKEAVGLFIQMHRSRIVPTPYVLSTVLSACTKIELFESGEQVHGLVFKQGFSSQTFVCNALVLLYSRCENWMSAEKVFSEMESRDQVTYNSLISGLVQSGFSKKALELYVRMQVDCFKAGVVTVASLLSACASIGDFQRGKQLHSYAIKAGILHESIIEGSLLYFYAKCSDIKFAHEFFLTADGKNVVLWNIMLIAFGQLGDLTRSVEMLKQMQLEHVMPNQNTYSSILKTCSSLGFLDEGEQVHTHIIKMGFHGDVHVSSVLVEMYAKHGELATAHDILIRIPEEDIVSWTAMMAGYIQHTLYSEALQLFIKMQHLGIRTDNIGLACAISACAGIQKLDQGQQIQAQSLVLGYSYDSSIGIALVSLYSRCGRIQEARAVFKKIEAKDNNILWNVFISGAAQSGHFEEALQIFSEMNKAGVEANLYTICSATSAAANIANMMSGRQIHAMIIKTGYNSEIEVSNVLISLYSKCGNIKDAKREFDELPGKNQVSWNAIITGFSQHGHGTEALSLFEEMKLLGISPNDVTFVGVLSACSHVGLVDKGLEYFKFMEKNFGLVPKPVHYVCIVDLLSRAGYLLRAKEFVEQMPIAPDALIWRTLLSACTSHKNVEIGEFAANHLLELEPGDSSAYVLLSNLYVAAGKQDCVLWPRQSMKEKGVKKEPGYSWIEIKNSVHAFIAGDRIHPLADKIYNILTYLDEQAAGIGYVCEKPHLWIVAEEGTKQSSAYVHSEKLAVALGLLTLPDIIPIRVIKNLRICSDCHNWMKFVSKISSRRIIVRDTYRFHHFDNGYCSCKDYW